MEPLSIFGRFVQIVTETCFLDSFCQFSRSIQIAAIMLQTIPSFYTKLSEESLVISADTNEKKLDFQNYCIAHHDDKTCFLPACKYHFILLGNVEELLKRLDTHYFTYQHV